jgi:hypothetical protein
MTFSNVIIYRNNVHLGEIQLLSKYNLGFSISIKTKGNE